MRIFRAVPGCLGLLLALGCTTPEGFRGAGDAGGSGTGGAIGTTGTGGAFPGTGGADPGTGGGGGTTGSGGADPGTGGSGGTTGSGGAGTGGRGSGGAVVDAGRDMPSEPPADSGGDSDTRDAPDDMGSQVLTFENDCLRVRWTASASLQTAMAIGAVDGDPATEWWTATPQVGGESFQINFGGSVRLTQLVLDNTGGNQTDYPRGYNILASTDGNTFPTMVASAKPGPAGAITTINFTAATARSIRIVQTGTDPTFWWTIRELRVACQPATPPPAGAVDPLDPSHWTVTASSNVGGAGPGNAIDGDFNTRWQSGVHQQGNEWFLVDLSAPTTVSEVWLTTRLSPGDFPAQYAVEVSTNGTNYASVATGVGDVVSQITFNPVTARYVRIKQTGMTAAAGGAWWSIDELSIRP